MTYNLSKLADTAKSTDSSSMDATPWRLTISSTYDRKFVGVFTFPAI